MSTDSKVKALLRETLLTLCKASIDFKSELRIEAVIGITVDHEKVLLVSLHETQSTGGGLVSTLKETSGSHVEKPSTHSSQKAYTADIMSARPMRVVFSNCTGVTKNGAKSQRRSSVSKSSIENGINKSANQDSRMHHDEEADIKPSIDNEGDVDSPFIGDVSVESNHLNYTESDNFISSVQDVGDKPVRDKTLKFRRIAPKIHCESHTCMPAGRSKPGLPFATRIEAIRLFEQMGSSLRVAKYLGITDGQVRRILDRKNELLAYASSGFEGNEFMAKKKKLAFDQRIEAIHMYDVVQSTYKVAQHFGVGATQIRAILKCRQELLSLAGETDDMETTNS